MPGYKKQTERSTQAPKLAFLSPPRSMMPRLSKPICSLLKFLFKYIPKSNASHYVSLQRSRPKKKKEKRNGFCCCFVWRGDMAIIETRLCFYFMKPRRVIHWDPDILYHLITSVARYLFALAPSVPHTDMAAGTYWSPLLGGLLSTPKAGFGRKKQHLLYWKTSSYLISWKRNVSANVLKRWLSYIKMSTPKAITPAATSHRSHPEGR